MARGGCRGQVRADQCGHVREIAQGSIPGPSGEARPLCFSLCHSLSRTLYSSSASVYSVSHSALPVPGILTLSSLPPLSLSFSLTRFLSHSLSLTRFLSHSFALSLVFSLSVVFSLTRFLSRSFSLSLSCSPLALWGPAVSFS